MMVSSNEKHSYIKIFEKEIRDRIYDDRIYIEIAIGDDCLINVYKHGRIIDVFNITSSIKNIIMFKDKRTFNEEADKIFEKIKKRHIPIGALTSNEIKEHRLVEEYVIFKNGEKISKKELSGEVIIEEEF